ncbi:cytosine permease [Streptomyces sp. NPDC047117]|uniref:purine-cytosine permease family protein n=1 Tax=Streptomyces sp. NPDC047117 TaxID=3155379 RepID=UPI0034072817
MAATLPDPTGDGRKTDGRQADVEPPPALDRAGKVEARGIDFIPERERHGRARELWAVWAAPNVSYLSLVVGGALTVMGLSLWQSLAVILVGNLCWLLVGLLAVSGPASGTPSEVVMRAMYGIRGNRVAIAVTGWAVCVCYVALNLAAASGAAVGLVERLGVKPGTGVEAAVVVAVAAVTLAISVYGHATIVKLYLPLTALLTVVFAVLAGYIVAHADWGYRPDRPLHGLELWAAVTAGLTLVASGPLSYSNSADFSRYLPPATSPRAVAGWTALGAYVPSVLLTGLGALAGTALDMTDPQAALEGIVPAWFRPVFLFAVVLGTVAINAMTAYSSGLALQAVGVRIRRSLSVFVDGLLSVALTLYALFFSGLLDTVSNVLQLTVALLGPGMAVYATDIVLRRNRYDGRDLCDESPGSRYWYTAGVNRAGAAALVLATAAAALCVHTPLFTGPVARATGGMDLSLPVGFAVAPLVYVLLTRSRATR